MKRVVIVLALLLVISMVSAKEITVVELFEMEPLSPGITRDSEGLTTYFYAGERLVASKGNELKYSYKERLGSDTKGRHLPFGQELIDSGERFEFTGKEFDDESGLNDFDVRSYDSSIGKFLSVDPVEDELAYGYVSNNPMNYVDPSGTESDFYLGAYASNQFTEGYNTFYGVSLFDEKVFGLEPEVSLNFIAGGSNAFSQITHPIYSDFNLDLNRNVGPVRLSYEHASEHSLSAGEHPSSDLKDFPTYADEVFLIEREITREPGTTTLLETWWTMEKRQHYFATSDMFMATYENDDISLGAGFARLGNVPYLSTNSILDTNGPPLLLGFGGGLHGNSRGLMMRASKEAASGEFVFGGFLDFSGEGNNFMAINYESDEFNVPILDRDASASATATSTGNFALGFGFHLF